MLKLRFEKDKKKTSEKVVLLFLSLYIFGLINFFWKNWILLFCNQLIKNHIPVKKFLVLFLHLHHLVSSYHDLIN